MGVWERSPAGIAIANRNKGLIEDFWQTLPDYRPADNVGSPFCVRQYVVDEPWRPRRPGYRAGGTGQAGTQAFARFRPELNGARPSVGYPPARILRSGKQR
jgi:hypothetical protein